jgi:CheY-like chemotaxis protein
MNEFKSDERLRPLDILLVDDNEDDVDIALRTFTRLKLKNHVYIARDGQEALDYLNHVKQFEDDIKNPTPDVIFLDISMPKLNGFEVLSAIKKNEDYCYIPVIMLSSSRNEKDIFRAFRLGAAAYIPKPLDNSEFAKIVDVLNAFWQVTRLPQKQISAKSV